VTGSGPVTRGSGVAAPADVQATPSAAHTAMTASVERLDHDISVPPRAATRTGENPKSGGSALSNSVQ
jgi:hypothetical protein